ncbi:hypothetical protein GPECTOR_46g195 [Gonium pectorale]|uniref:BACK domain-containing protein n=1 Tax=Gonium pectorale TaxID=33097 RepID=A0A150G8D7_GONPE|nr:hypothetical protein GPECTOR_46g195 [Gonium pectorale]|eukprot:KXZ46126.1 hypothetical protein GPECTOR_46g195 [Gonium pectorale]
MLQNGSSDRHSLMRASSAPESQLLQRAASYSALAALPYNDGDGTAVAGEAPLGWAFSGALGLAGVAGRDDMQAVSQSSLQRGATFQSSRCESWASVGGVVGGSEDGTAVDSGAVCWGGQLSLVSASDGEGQAAAASTAGTRTVHAVEAADIMLHFMYTGRLPPGLLPPQLLSLLLLADQYGVVRLLSAVNAAFAGLPLPGLALPQLLALYELPEVLLAGGQLAGALSRLVDKLVSDLGDLELVLDDPGRKAQLVGLPYEAMRLLLQSEEVRVWNENTAVAALVEWAAGPSGQAASPEQRRQLAGLLRLQHCTHSYLAYVIPHSQRVTFDWSIDFATLQQLYADSRATRSLQVVSSEPAFFGGFHWWLRYDLDASQPPEYREHMGLACNVKLAIGKHNLPCVKVKATVCARQEGSSVHDSPYSLRKSFSYHVMNACPVGLWGFFGLTPDREAAAWRRFVFDGRVWLRCTIEECQ